MSSYPYKSDIFNNKEELQISPLTISKGNTELIKEVLLGDTEECLQILKNHPEQLNTQNEEGWTALMIAAINSEIWELEPMVLLLIKAGADVNLQEKNGWTALMLAARCSANGSSETTVKILIDAKADVNLQNTNGWTALMMAVQNSTNWSSEATVKMLIDAGTAVNIQNKDGWTALMMAVQYINRSSEATVKMLLDAGADPTIKDNLGRNVVKKTIQVIEKIKLEKEIQSLKRIIEQLQMENHKLNLRPYPGREYLKLMQEECGGLTEDNIEEFVETNKLEIVKAFKNGMLFE